MSTSIYRYEFKRSYKINNSKHLLKVFLIDGSLGLTLSILKKEGEDYFYKIDAKETSKKNIFSVTEKIEDKNDKKKDEEPVTKEIDLSELKKKKDKLIKNTKELIFVKEYMETDRNKLNSGNIKTTINDNKKTSTKLKIKNLKNKESVNDDSNKLTKKITKKNKED